MYALFLWHLDFNKPFLDTHKMIDKKSLSKGLFVICGLPSYWNVAILCISLNWYLSTNLWFQLFFIRNHQVSLLWPLKLGRMEHFENFLFAIFNQLICIANWSYNVIKWAVTCFETMHFIYKLEYRKRYRIRPSWTKRIF